MKYNVGDEVWYKGIIAKTDEGDGVNSYKVQSGIGRFFWTNEETLTSLKPTVPPCAADWYEENKYTIDNKIFNLCRNIANNNIEQYSKEFINWFAPFGNNSIQTLINMHQFGYEVEEEKLYYIVLPYFPEDEAYVNYSLDNDSYYIGTNYNSFSYRNKFTKGFIEENLPKYLPFLVEVEE